MLGVQVHYCGKGKARDREVSQKLMETMTRPIFVVGKAEHGKSTVRKILSEMLGVRGGSCSDSIYAVWSLLVGVAEEELRRIPKSQSRPLLVALGNWLTTEAESFETNFPRAILPNADPSRLQYSSFPSPHPGALIQYACFNGVKVLDGVRREVEMQAAVPRLAWVGAKPYVIEVHNPRVPDVEDNFDLSSEWVDFGIMNDGSVEELAAKCRVALKFYQHEMESDLVP